MLRPLVAGGLAALVLTGCAGSPATVSAPPSPSPSAAPVLESAAPVPVPSTATAAVDPGSRPARLQVPAVGIDTVLIDLGIAADGTLEVPTDYAQAGWLDRSPTPGSRGPAVLAGHVDSKAGPAVFYRLRDLVAGDQVVVTRADGQVVRFTVDGVQQYAKDAFPTDAVYGPVPGPVLRLITCGGTFDRGTGHYRDNLVVYATGA